MSRVLHSLASHPGDAPALCGNGISLDYATLQKKIALMSHFLEPFAGKTVALIAANSPAWIVTDLACVRMGMPLVPIPPFFTPEQTEHVLADAGVSLIITDNPKFFNTGGIALEIVGSTYHVFLREGDTVALPAGTQKITYTSGTTGTPKGVCLGQAGMEQVATGLLEQIGAASGERHASLLPLAILLENIAGVYTALLGGGYVYLDPVAHTPAAIAGYLSHTHATSCILVPELLRMILATDVALPDLRFAAVGGARVAPALLEAAHARHIPVYEGYGLSECASVVALNTQHNNHPGSVGTLLPHMSARIAEDGEIILKNALFLGYLGDPTTNAAAEYATGDLGHFDEAGRLFIDGRKKHMFITSFGRNVSPEWPESLLTSQPGIFQAAVFGEAMPSSVAVIVAASVDHARHAVAAINGMLPNYARIGDFILATEPFTPANHQLTGNGRPRRDAIWTRYGNEFSQSLSA